MHHSSLSSFFSLIIVVLLFISTLQATLQLKPGCSASNTGSILMASGNTVSYETCTGCLDGFYHTWETTISGASQEQDVYNCYACNSNCRTCSVISTNCTTCVTGFYLNADTKICESCTNILTYCGDCSETTCNSCSSPYTLDTFFYVCNLDCSSYGAGCLTCDPTQCLSCSPGNFLSATAPFDCVSCVSVLLNCNACSDLTTCTSCNTDTYLDIITPSNGCSPCTSIANCVSCIDGPQCTQCDPYYALSDASSHNTCYLCPQTYYAAVDSCYSCGLPHCGRCGDFGNGVECTLCVLPYSLDTLGQCILDCQLGYGTQCLTCDPTTCLSCSTGYAFDSAAPTNCTACNTLLNCLGCTDGLICTQCSSGFYHDFSTPKHDCVPCSNIANCLSCQDGLECTQCATNHILSATGAGNTCNSCPAAHYASSSTVCTPCPSNCAACTNTVTGVQCQSCVTAYDLINNACIINCPAKYGALCSTCGSTGCLTCITGYAFPSASPTVCTTCSNLPNCVTCTDGLVCSQCSSGLVTDFATPNRTCVSCSIPNCISCKNGPQCSQCSLNYVFNVTGPLNGCTTCPVGSYASSTAKCTPCPEECVTCSNSVSGIICPSCNPIANHDPTLQICIKCDRYMDHCTQCSSLSICTLCQYPYKLGSTQLCDQCEPGFQNFDGFCTKSPGCQIYLPNESRCLTCFVLDYFSMDPTTKGCKCKTGFYEKNIGGTIQCFSKCGDGIFVLGDEDCDDGNSRNDDGCSNTCQKQDSFTCTETSPSQCTLQFTPIVFLYNYAYRYEGQNKGKFSLSLYPSHPSLKYINWASYLTFNISDSFIVKNSKVFTYISQTNELTIDFEYLATLQNTKVLFTLFFDQSNVKFTQLSDRIIRNISSDKPIHETQSSQMPHLVKQGLSTFPLLQSSKSMTLLVEISGVNSKLVLEKETILQVYKAACIGSLIVTILILLQFIVGSYVHKMIGIETIQILQFFYFVRIIIDQQLSSFLNSMNIFKYAAYGGYSNYQVFYGNQFKRIQFMTYMTVDSNFVMVDLMKYFSLNVNFSLFIPILTLIGFLFTLSRKYKKRNQYLKSLEQSIKDQYTKFRRSSQWVYDHFVFPYINIFNMVAIFSTVLYLQSKKASTLLQDSNSDTTKLIQISSFSPHLAITFITFFIYCFEIFQSYEEFIHSKLTEAEKAKVPKSIYEKLEHDENNPDRPNYKPGYILFYLVFYFLVEVALMLNILLETIKDFKVQIMLILSFLYLFFVWYWRPYNQAVEFHNKALIFNHSTVFIFMVISVFSNHFQINPILYAVLICIILIMLTIVSIYGYIRIVIEYKFRKQLLENSNLMNGKAKPIIQSNQIDANQRKQGLLVNNPFAFQNQVRTWLKDKSHFDLTKLTTEKIENAKMEFRKHLYEENKAEEIQKRWKNWPETYEYQTRFKKKNRYDKSSDLEYMQKLQAELPSKPFNNDIPTPKKIDKMNKNTTEKR